MSDKTILVELKQQANYQFNIVFNEHMPPLLSDEPPPLGEGKGPSPVQLSLIHISEPTRH